MSSKQLSDLELEVVQCINRLRTAPQSEEFSGYLQAELDSFAADGRTINRPSGIGLTTNEGRAAWEEALEYLQNAEPLEALAVAPGAVAAARDHAQDLASGNTMGHSGSDGSTMGERMNRYGEWMWGCNECISFGSDTAMGIVMQLFVDDGVASRGHRSNLFDRGAKVVGVACATHPTYSFCAVIDMANDYHNEDDSQNYDVEMGEPVAPPHPKPDPFEHEEHGYLESPHQHGYDGFSPESEWSNEVGSHGASFKIGELNGMVFGGGFGDWGADGDDFGGGSCGMTSVSTQVSIANGVKTTTVTTVRDGTTTVETRTEYV